MTSEPALDAKQRTVVATIASAGRPALLGDLLDALGQQTRPPDRIVLAVPDDASLPKALPSGCTAVLRSGGLAAQRNAAVDAAQGAGVLVAFDDDTVPEPRWIERALAHFDDAPHLVGLTGRVLLDGARGDTVDAAIAAAAIRAAPPSPPRTRRPIRGLYGCNFAVRAIPALPRFDERLPLYSWLEDRDFSHRLARHGALARVEDCMVVHLGAESGGRTAHTRLGYAQVMNPVHFWRTGSFLPRETLWEAGHLVAKNLLRAVAGPGRDWRRQRLRGNVLAIRDVLAGRIEPERMLDHH